MLVLRPGALGDTLLAVPALRALKDHFGPLTLAAHAGAARLLASLGEVEHGLSFDDDALSWLFRDRKHAHRIVGWLDPAGIPALDHALLVAPSKPAGDEHCAQYLLNSLAPLRVDTRLDDRPLHLRPQSSDDFFIHPGSGSAAKNWPAERFAEVIRALDCPVRLIVGEADEQAARAVEAALGRTLPWLSHLALEDLAARLAGSRGYLGNDSGVSHLAGLCGARTVVLFGPTSPRVWRPLGPRVSVVPFDVQTRTVVALL